MNKEYAYQDFSSSYFSGLSVPSNIQRRHVPYSWFTNIAKDSVYNLLLLFDFLKKNKRLLTAKQNKRLIKEFLYNGYTNKQEKIKYLFSALKIKEVLETTCFTKLEFMVLLKDLSINHAKNLLEFHSKVFEYRKKFEDYDEQQTLNLFSLLVMCKSNLFTQETDPELITTCCEMLLNNSIKDLTYCYATKCYNHYYALYTILTEEKDSIYCYDLVISIVVKFLFKFYCEKTVIPLLAQIPSLSVNELKDKIMSMHFISIMYLEILLLSEPELNEKLIYRLSIIEKKLNIDPSFVLKWEDNKKTQYVELIDTFRLKEIHSKIEELLLYIKTKFPSWSILGFNPSYVNWNFPTLSYISNEDMKTYLKDSNCNLLHLSTQGYNEFYQIDNEWIQKGVRKFEDPVTNRKFLKYVIGTESKYILDTEKIGTYWGYKCMDEYHDVCNSAKSCTLVNSIEQNKEALEKLKECYIKREVYQLGSISNQDEKKINGHYIQISEKKDQIIDCNEIIYDQTNV